MSTIGGLSSTPSQVPTTAAADVSFQRLADHHNGESSSHGSLRSRQRSRSREAEEQRRSREVEEQRRSREVEDQRRSKEEPRRSQETPPSRSPAKLQKSVGSAHRHRTSGGFLLDSAAVNGSPKGNALPHRDGKRKAQNGFLHVEKRGQKSSRLSGDSSIGSSPLSRQISHEHGGSSQGSSRPPSMDPAQLVQMALELSESRRRQVSGGLQIPLPSPRDRRRVSTLRPSGTVRVPVSPQDRTSHDNSNGVKGTSIPYSSSRVASGQGGPSLGYDGVAGDEEPRNFTPATLSRAERARKYFELASEHRRLLLTLPPLKPDGDAPGNHTYTAKNSPGSTFPEISRTVSRANNKHELGRQYNPLQALRNRRLRNRERQPLPAPIETWQDTDIIRAWVDDVETAVEHPEYRSTPDQVQLPDYDGDDGGEADQRVTSRGHRRTDTVSSVITRPENGWSIEPCELLADTYWTEKGDNKALVENRRGIKLFPALVRRSMDQARASRESGRVSSERQTLDLAQADEIPFYKRAHRGPHFLPRKHKVLPRSGSVSSVSSAEGRHVPNLNGSLEDDFDNIGPLEKQMQKLIAQEAKAQATSPTSPELLSPDHWNSEHTPFPNQRSRRDTRSHEQEIAPTQISRLSVDTAREHKRAKSADGRVGASDGRPSIDRGNSYEARSPTIAGFRNSLDIDRSLPEDRQSLIARQKSRLHRLPFMRSHSKERSGTERTDFADRATLANEGTVNESRLSQDSARPSFVQRQRTADSTTGSFKRQGTGESAGSAKDSGSVMGRLLKGGRVGDLMRTESSRISDRFRSKDRVDDLSPHSERSDSGTDEEAELPANYTGDPSPRTSLDVSRAKGKYHLPNLPSFKSPAARGSIAGSISNDSDPITRQQQAQRDAAKPSRFNHLPRINLPADDGSAINLSVQDLENDRRKSYGFLGQGSGPSSRITFGPVEENASGHSTPGQHRLHTQRGRHWSISDQRMPEKLSTKVTMRDVARAKALLLSSGVKAREIQRRADLPRDESLSLYTDIQKLVGKEIGPVSRREEHLVVSRMLADHLTSSLADIENALGLFQQDPTKRLGEQINALGRKAGDELATVVHDTSDDADAFIIELTTKAPQDVKRVDDAVDDILRQRRRQFRLLRKTGFKLLEWLVLGIMWWVWFLVVLFNTGKRIVLASFALVRWLLWF
ncbi:hypothetical protein LTR78_004838 [Recurvomyces mirabilis]|uniref:Uncharacterized protein n=1 Tax=Recurvomyces mirabilis TaxID=574656 RepID=A0AAE0WP51_9PEZI|nr:hypothetical protein LTR78_004838 [Recurvomyces mirabilis]KAK5158008.1 hypothetical protein LTS14_003931 [Recurvomyces mirabilis]